MAELKQFALLIDGEFKEVRKYEKQPKDIPHKKVVWLPYVDEVVDNARGDEKIKVRGDKVIENGRVVCTTTVRDKTPQELAAEKDDIQEAEFSHTLRDNSLLKALTTTTFELVNDVRSMKGEKPIKPDQFKGYLKGKM